MKKSNFIIPVLVLFVCNTIAIKHLSEKPTFLTPCDWNDADFNNCMIKNYQGLFTEWKDGVPGLKSVGSLDPLEIKRVTVSQNDNDLINLNADLTEMYVKGASNVLVKSAIVRRDHYEIKVFFPKLRTDTNYKLNGRVLQLPVNGQGKGYFETEKTTMTVSGNMKAHKADSITFADVQTLNIKIDDIENFHIQLDNLFDGQKDLGDAANALFNENWRDLIHVLRPVLEQTLEAVLQDRFKKIFKYLPASYIFTEY